MIELFFPSPTKEGGTGSSSHMGTNDESAKICSRQKQIIRCMQQYGYSPKSILLYFTFENTLSRAKLKKTSYKSVHQANFYDKTT